MYLKNNVVSDNRYYAFISVVQKLVPLRTNDFYALILMNNIEEYGAVIQYNAMLDKFMVSFLEPVNGNDDTISDWTLFKSSRSLKNVTSNQLLGFEDLVLTGKYGNDSSEILELGKWHVGSNELGYIKTSRDVLYQSKVELIVNLLKSMEDEIDATRTSNFSKANEYNDLTPGGLGFVEDFLIKDGLLHYATHSFLTRYLLDYGKNKLGLKHYITLLNEYVHTSKSVYHSSNLFRPELIEALSIQKAINDASSNLKGDIGLVRVSTGDFIEPGSYFFSYSYDNQTLHFMKNQLMTYQSDGLSYLILNGSDYSDDLSTTPIPISSVSITKIKFYQSHSAYLGEKQSMPEEMITDFPHEEFSLLKYHYTFDSMVPIPNQYESFISSTDDRIKELLESVPLYEAQLEISGDKTLILLGFAYIDSLMEVIKNYNSISSTS